jgi:hypothetical protein
MTSRVEVGRPEVRYGPGTAEIRCQVSGDRMPDALWFRVPARFAEFLAVERPDWILTALLLPAMVRGARLVVDAPVSERLHYGVTGDLPYVLRKQDARLQDIAIESSGLSPASRRGRGTAVGTGFSAGIDSFSTVMDTTSEKLSAPHQLTHLVVLNVGAMGEGEKAAELFARYSERVARYAAASGLDFVTVDSNLVEFYTGDFTFQQTHTIRNAAGVLALQPLFRRYYYSSSFEYTKHFVGPTYDMSFADPLILSMLGTEDLEFVSAGSRYSRLDKVKRVASFPDSYGFLDVCVGDAQRRAYAQYPNCSVCWKCGRQLLTLELLGKLDAYREVFDLDRYRAARTDILASVLRSAYCKKQPNDLDVIRLARSSGKFRVLNDRMLDTLLPLAPERTSRWVARLNDLVV